MDTEEPTAAEVAATAAKEAAASTRMETTAEAAVLAEANNPATTSQKEASTPPLGEGESGGNQESKSVSLSDDDDDDESLLDDTPMTFSLKKPSETGVFSCDKKDKGNAKTGLKRRFEGAATECYLSDTSLESATATTKEGCKYHRVATPDSTMSVKTMTKFQSSTPANQPSKAVVPQELLSQEFSTVTVDNQTEAMSMDIERENSAGSEASETKESDGQKEACLSDEASYSLIPVRALESFNFLWPLLKRKGWYCIKSGRFSNLDNYYYLKPYCPKDLKGMKQGQDYFKNPAGVLRYVNMKKGYVFQWDMEEMLTRTCKREATWQEASSTSTKVEQLPSTSSPTSAPPKAKKPDHCFDKKAGGVLKRMEQAKKKTKSKIWWTIDPVPGTEMVWPILKEKFGVRYWASRYRLAGSTTSFYSQRGMRRYLCRTGIPSRPSNLTVEELEVITRWVSTANLNVVPHSSVASLRKCRFLTSPMAWNILELSMGYTWANGKYYLPGAEPKDGKKELCVRTLNKDCFDSIEDLRFFLRCHGIGYRYDATDGSYTRTEAEDVVQRNEGEGFSSTRFDRCLSVLEVMLWASQMEVSPFRLECGDRYSDFSDLANVPKISEDSITIKSEDPNDEECMERPIGNSTSRVKMTTATAEETAVQKSLQTVPTNGAQTSPAHVPPKMIAASETRGRQTSHLHASPSRTSVYVEHPPSQTKPHSTQNSLKQTKLTVSVRQSAPTQIGPAQTVRRNSYSPASPTQPSLVQKRSPIQTSATVVYSAQVTAPESPTQRSPAPSSPTQTAPAQTLAALAPDTIVSASASGSVENDPLDSRKEKLESNTNTDIQSTGDVVLAILKGDTGGGVTFFTFNADRTLILTAGRDMKVRIWKASTGECIKTHSGHKTTIVSACFCDDGRFVLTESKDEHAQVWEVV